MHPNLAKEAIEDIQSEFNPSNEKLAPPKLAC